MSADELKALHERAADLILTHATELIHGCGGDFSCEDCPCGVDVCKAEHAEMVGVVVKLRGAD